MSWPSTAARWRNDSVPPDAQKINNLAGTGSRAGLPSALRGCSADCRGASHVAGSGSDPRSSDLHVLDAGQLTEDPPVGRVVTKVHHLMVRPAGREPAVQACAQS